MNDTTQQWLIEARGIDIFYGQSHVLRGVDFHLGRGEAVGLLGRNGMGKSTLLKSLMGLVHPTSGEIFLGSESIAGYAPHRVAQLGLAYVPERRAIFGSLNVRENLQLAARAGRTGQQIWTYERILDAFPWLKKRLSSSAKELSGGEQKMLSIARALLTNPDALLLDEATEGLAPKIAQDIWRICKEITNSGISTIIVDKKWKNIAQITQRTVILVNGSLAFDDHSSLLESRPDVVARYLGI